jgi:O-antigen ligase
MTISSASGTGPIQQRSFVFGAFVLLAGLIFTFFNTLGVGFSSFRAPALLGWLCASVVTACLAIYTKKEKTNWAALLLSALFVFIAIRQGPKPIHATALAFIVLTMACVAHTAVLFARFSSWALVLALAVVSVATLNAFVALYQYAGFSVQYPIPYMEMTLKGMAIGQVRQRNQMAILCVLGLATLAYFPNKFRWWALVRYVLGLVLVAAVAVSASRIGALAVILFSCTLMATFKSVPRSSKLLIGLAFPIFLLFAYALPLIVGDQAGLFSRFKDDAFAVPCNSRLLLWKNALSLIPNAPWAGAGWGGFILEYYMSDLPARGCELLDNAHNVYLQVAVEAGLPAAVILIFISLWYFIKHWCAVRTDDIYRWAYFCVAIIWLYAQTDYPLWETGFLWLFAIFLGISAAGSSSAPNVYERLLFRRPLPALNPRLIFIIAATTACLSVMALVQYFRVSSIATSVDWEKEMAKRGYVELVKENWMFADHLEFITAQLQQPTVANAAKINKFCATVIAYSPEPPIIMCVIRSAYLMGDMKQVEFHEQRLLTTFGKQVDMYKKELESMK